MKEWEFQRARLHHRDSAKFTRLTPREASVPLDSGRHHDADLLILICSTIGIVVIVLLLAVGLI